MDVSNKERQKIKYMDEIKKEITYMDVIKKKRWVIVQK